MKRQLITILTILTFISCQNSRTENQLTKLEKFIVETDSLRSNSKMFDQIVNFIETKKPKYRHDEVTLKTEERSGLSRETEFGNNYDTTKKNKDRVLFSPKIKEFTSERKAAEAFQKIIEFHTSSIPEEDILKLKNFENLKYFKNSSSTTILSENIIIEYLPANQMLVNEDNTELFDEILKERKYLKLEIGQGGPAIWTRKSNKI